MKVKIAKCSDRDWWYKDKIGQEFEVLCEDNSKWDGNEEYRNPAMWWKEEAPSFIVKIPKSSWGLVRWEDVEGAKKVAHNKYLREIKPGVWVDIYDVLNAWKVTDPCLQHAAKKVLQAGERGHKDRLEDLNDVVASTQRAIEMHKEWNKE